MKRKFTNVSILKIMLLISMGTLLPYWLWAQETKEVQGIVINAAQEPIMGVSIGVKMVHKELPPIMRVGYVFGGT